MAINAYEVFKATNPALIEKLDANYDVSDFLMGFYKQIEIMAAESSNDPKNLMCSVDIVKERLLRITTRYYQPGSNASATDRHPSKRNINIVHLFEVNHNVRDVAVRVVEILDRWLREAYRKNQKFEDIKIVEAKLWADKTFTAELVMKIDFQEYVSKLMKTDLPPEQLTTEDQEKALEAAEKMPDIEVQWRE